MGGRASIIMPLVALVRRWCLRELQRQLRPIAPSRITGGWALSRGQLWGLAVIGLSVLAPMPPAPLGLLILGGACRIQFARFRNGLRGAFPAGDGEGYSSSVEKLLRIRRKIIPPAGSPEVAFAAPASVCCGRTVLPHSQYRRARRPPMLQIPFPLQWYFPFISARMQIKERGFYRLIKHNRHCLAGFWVKIHPKD